MIDPILAIQSRILIENWFKLLPLDFCSLKDNLSDKIVYCTNEMAEMGVRDMDNRYSLVSAQEKNKELIITWETDGGERYETILQNCKPPKSRNSNEG